MEYAKDISIYWGRQLTRFSRNCFVLVLCLLAVVGVSGCSASKIELDLMSYDPGQDHQKIAAYYSREATRLRQASEEMLVRITVYEQLFGPTSDWVTGTRLLAQLYENEAKEQERKAREHLEIIHHSRPPSVARPGSP